ncbi:MAG: cytochrome c peroxidase [Kofleriaceae bacterium]
MRTHSAVGMVLALVASTAACKKKGDEGGGGGGNAPAPTPPPAASNRPSQGALATMPPLALPDDPNRDAKVALGHALFFDKRLSFDGSRACYSCHMNENGTGGADPLAIGAGGKQLTRHAPMMWNVGYAKGAFYWDGRAATLEAQAKGAWSGGNMGVGEDKLAAKTAELAAIPGYATMWKAAFGDAAATPEQVTEALAAYERTIVCTATPYDKFAAGDKTALTEAQQRGLDIFMSKGMCNACHTPPHFSVSMMTEGGVYWNAGIGIAGKDPAAVDIGRKKVTEKDTDWASFKVPSLRGVGKSPPYFHDGSVATLEAAVRYMASAATPNPNLSPLFNDKKLTDAEITDLVDFVGNGLACPGGLEEPTLP